MILLSCSTGYFDQYGVYVPNNPRYKLKDKKGDPIPKELDTFNLYKYYGYYDSIKLVKDKLSNEWVGYKKFVSNGRVYSFGTEKLEKQNLNPEFASKGYYFYDKKREIIKYETFVGAEGGQYIILNYKLNKNGDTLTNITGDKKSHVYIKEIIPEEWKRYKADW